MAQFVHMPGKNRKGSLKLSDTQRTSRDKLQLTLNVLANKIGERSTKKLTNLRLAEKYVSEEFSKCGFALRTDSFEINEIDMHNIEAEQIGSHKPDEIVVIGAHYDTVEGSSGADDNASGVAALLEIAEQLSKRTHRRTVRFVAFANEEVGSAVLSDQMGSAFYARTCKERGENIVAMLSLEMLGYFSDDLESQKYPHPFSLFYPSKGNFIAFVGKATSKAFVRKCIKKFREVSLVPSEGVAAPDTLSHIQRSDHSGFWQAGYQKALMVTDTANFRNPNYHSANDTVDTIDFDRLTLVTSALIEVVQDLLN